MSTSDTNQNDVDFDEYCGEKTYLSLKTFGDSPRQFVVASVGIQDNYAGDGKEPVLFFESGEALACNPTRVRDLKEHFGRHSRDLIGRELEVYSGSVKTKKGMADCLRVRTPAETIDFKKEAARAF